MSFAEFLWGAVAINLLGAMGTVIVFLGSGSVFRALLVGSLFYLGLVAICFRYYFTRRDG